MNTTAHRNGPCFRFVGVVFCLWAWSGTAAGEGMSAGDFTRLVDGLHSQIKDVWFIFEGQTRGIEGEQAGEPDDGQFFQGTYAFRSDGATLLDVYAHGARTDVPYMRTTLAALKGKLEQVDRIPDREYNPTPLVSNASPGAFDRPMSAQRFLYFSYFRDHSGLANEDFTDEGWEDLAGHRCFRVRINVFPAAAMKRSPGATMVWNRLWIDVERGGHPLRDELWRGRDLWSRTEIELEQVSGPSGKRIWFPARATSDSFVREDGSVSTRPRVRETYSVVAGTPRFNQGLADKIFSVKYNGSLPETAGLRTQRRLFQSIPPPWQQGRNDPESIQRDLNERLAEADKQSKELDASSTVGTYRDWTLILPVALTSAGFLALLCVLFLKRRGA
jgi:hypothetical protein